MMKVFQGLPESVAVSGCAVAIGNFDGVHRGHQAIIEKLNREADKRGIPSCVLTFEPHPRDYFALLTGQKAAVVSRITSSEEKVAVLGRHGVDQVVVLAFDRQLASCSSQGFIEDVLVRGLGAAYVLVGEDFHFGAGRAGNVKTLAEAGKRFRFDVECMPQFICQGERISSTIIRRALAKGDIAKAESLLGRGLAPRALQARINTPRAMFETA